MAPGESSPSYEGWLTKTEASERIGLSPKTIERMAARGEIRKGLRRNIGTPPLTVFDPEEIKKIADVRFAQIAAPFRVNDSQTPEGQESNSTEIVPQRRSGQIAEVLGALVKSIKLNATWPAAPKALTEAEAMQYLGVGKAFLRNFPKLNVGRKGAAVYLRADLDNGFDAALARARAAESQRRRQRP